MASATPAAVLKQIESGSPDPIYLVQGEDELEAFIKEPERQTVVVFVAATVDKRGRMYKLLQKHATIVECGVLQDQADAERWVRTRVAAAGAEIDPAAARLVAQRAGIDVK